MLDSASDLLASVLVACPALQARWSDRMEVDADSEHAAALGELTEQALRAATTLFGGLAACVKLIGLGGQP